MYVHMCIVSKFCVRSGSFPRSHATPSGLTCLHSYLTTVIPILQVCKQMQTEIDNLKAENQKFKKPVSAVSFT